MSNICKSCYSECQVIKVDHGIGWHEYWGSVRNDTRTADVSDCCEADYTDYFSAADIDDCHYNGGAQRCFNCPVSAFCEDAPPFEDCDA